VQTGIQAIQAAHPSSKGRLEAFVVDLADLTTLKPAVEKLLEKEQKLHVLVHNAGVMMPPEGSKTSQVCGDMARCRPVLTICEGV
jgi:NADP-dependent 3-hydroxy acid dehydrogenase YdfG